MPTRSPSSPAWRIGDRVVFRGMYGGETLQETRVHAVYEVRGIDGDAVWLRRDGGHVTAKAHWLKRAV